MVFQSFSEELAVFLGGEKEIVLLIIAINFISLLCYQTDTITSQPAEAIQIWEQAIAAKGGRHRLHAVGNMVISTRGEYASRLLKKNQDRREELIVFPNKYWFWDDYRPDVFGLIVSMYDYDRNLSYVITGVEPHSPLKPIKGTQRNKAIRNAQLSFLLESKWLRPTIVKASTERIGTHPVDIVQTIVEGERVDFAFDRKTHLLIRIRFHDVVDGKTYVNEESYSDYYDVNGIKVPQIIEFKDGSKYRARFQFNVEYNEEIFIKPAPIEAGPEAWKQISKK
jgi:hypothetical protein